MKVSEVGEFGIINRLAETLAAQVDVESAERLAVGIGDDAAVWRIDGAALIATTDTLVAGVHFLPERAPWRDVGWKALAVNISDVAAMGGTPEFALVTLALPPDAEAESLDELYAGLAEAGSAYSTVIAGGDIVRSQTFAVTVAVVGRADVDAAGEPVLRRRGAARVGDLIAVTGSLGAAAGGVRVLRDGPAEDSAGRVLIERQLRPRPRVSAGRAAIAAGLRCGIDISDGLLQDVGHICEASRLGAVIWQDRLPVDPAVRERFEDEAEVLRLAAAGGEDYELVLAGEQEQIDAVARQTDVPVTVIGEMVIQKEHAAKLLDEAAREVELPYAGYDQLRAEARG